MDLKFYLNKFLKVDNIEKYTLKTLITLREKYEDFLESSDGIDPDFPTLNFGKKGKRIRGRNIMSVLSEDELADIKKKKKVSDVFSLL